MALSTFGLQDLISAMAANYAAAAGLPANVGTGSQFGPMFRAIALAELLLQNENLYLQSIARLATMQDPLPDGTPNPDVDSFLNDFWPGPGNFRNGGTPSQVYVQFTIPSVSNQDTIVPVGTLTGTVGGPQFPVVANGYGYSVEAGGYVITAGQTSVLALTACSSPGSQGNVLANTITQFISGPNSQPPPAPFTVTNPYAYNSGDGHNYNNTPGVDPEVGAPLKQRFALYISGGGEGTVNSILAATGAVQTGITFSLGDMVEATESHGVWSFAPNTPGYFTIIANIANQSGLPPPSLLNAIQAALLYGVRAAGISYVVLAPTLVTVSGAGNIVVAPGYNATTVQNAVNAAFTAFVNAIGLDPYGNSTTCAASAVAAALQAIPGVLYIDNLTLNSASADVQAPFGSQLVAGTASFVA